MKTSPQFCLPALLTRTLLSSAGQDAHFASGFSPQSVLDRDLNKMVQVENWAGGQTPGVLCPWQFATYRLGGYCK